MLRNAGFSEFAMMKLAQDEGAWARRLLDCNTRQKIGSQLWRAWRSVLFGEGKAVHFKGQRYFNSVEGKTNKSGIRTQGGDVRWLGLSLPIEVEPGNSYEMEAMGRRVVFTRIVRRAVRGKRRYFAQLVLEGAPPERKRSDGLPRRTLGKGRVGIDIGTRTVAVSSEGRGVLLAELADKAQPHYRERRRIERAMERSKRATNPGNYAPDGTVPKVARRWRFSRRYEKLRSRRQELYRKEAAVRRYQHELLSNEILSMGSEYVVESMDFRALAKKAKSGGRRPDGRPSKRKRFGRSVGEKAPGMLVSMIERKSRGRLRRVDTASFRASQLDHATGKFAKKPLSQRWTTVSGVRVQRDLYSAFLLMCASDEADRADRARCEAAWPRFVADHRKEVERLSRLDGLPSSMGIA